jgi:nitronate monooxygenase
MGVGVSLHPLASAVAVEGGMGIVSSACLDRLVSKRLGKQLDTYEAAYDEISMSRARGGLAGMNIMVALGQDYAASVKASIDAGAAAIISGAGLPLSLPAIQPPGDTALIPIVSSARALDIILKKWARHKYRPDAVVLEGPLAGGHLGFTFDQIELESNRLENLLPPVKELAMKNGDFPVIVAGGIYSHEDIARFIALGADGVQMGTRFLVTNECSATDVYKQSVVEATADDIIVAYHPGTPASPCGLPFRIIKHSPMYQSCLTGARPPHCNKSYVLMKDHDGNYNVCAARKGGRDYFCICNGLLSSAGYNSDEEEPLYTVGTSAARIDRIVSVKELMDELKGCTEGAGQRA